ncbi:MAG TPA: hypothetical protein VHD62_14640 [Opitutaceae bacterium]|nr:hypothetical protein [Opitutaceae bacterium]
MNALASQALFDRDVSVIPRFAQLRGWTVHRIEFPVVDVTFVEEGRKPLRVRLVAKEWDELPPSIELLAPNGEFLQVNQTPAQGIFNPNAHGNTGRPFVCMIGTLEYHTHGSHINDHWENYRRQANRGLTDLLGQIWNGWLRAPK